MCRAFWSIYNCYTAASQGFRLPSLPQVHVITTQRCKVRPHIHRRLVDCPVTYCLQMCSNQFPQLSIFLFFPIFVVLYFACMHSTRSRLMHTQPQLFVYSGIFSNGVGEGYTAGGKHWFEGGVPVFHLSCLFTGALPALYRPQKSMMDGDNLRKSASLLIEIQPGVQKYQNIVVKPIFEEHFTALGQWQKFSRKLSK